MVALRLVYGWSTVALQLVYGNHREMVGQP